MESISAAKRYAVVTGANKGIGLETCRQLASEGIFVILTARDEKRGSKAVEILKETGLSDVIFHQLDVKDPTSIASLARFTETRFGKLDILVNNAGISALTIDVEAFKCFKNGYLDVCDENQDLLKGVMEEPIEKAEELLKINYYGTKGVTKHFYPLLQVSNSARIVNLSSSFGQLMLIPNENTKAEFNSESLTEERIDELLKWFVKDFKEDKLQVNGWPITFSSYKLSKAALNAYTGILARKYPKMRINCVHPGYVKTDMTYDTGLLTTEEGARGPVMLALLAQDGPTGHYFNQMDISTL